MIFLDIGIKIIQMKIIKSHNWNAVFKLSINLPASNGTTKELNPKHWEYKAIAVPLYLFGEDLIIASEAEGRKMQREIVRGMKAIIISKYPLFNKFEIDKKTKPRSNEIKHNLNL